MELSKETLQNEMSRWGGSFKPEAMKIAQKSLFLEKRGSVGIIFFDQFQEKANKLSTPNMLRLLELLQTVEADGGLQSLVILSKKPSIFIAGADISEIQSLSTGGKESVEALQKLQTIFTFLSELRVPTIAAIHGAALGGGLEFALACDFRMVTDAPETKLGLPEVQLGIIPGWGGTQRLPRLVGLEKALDLILTGRQVDGKSASRMGLADKLVPKELLEEKAFAWALQLSGKKPKQQDHRKTKNKILETVPGGRWLIFDQARKSVLQKTKGNYPAPLKALEVVKKGYGGSLENGLHYEAEAFAELVTTPECKSLINIFYLTEKVKKDKGAETAKAKEVATAGVVGAGVMGGGIAQLFSAKNIWVRMKDVNWDALTKGYQTAYKVFYKQVERRKMKKSDLANAMARISATTQYTGFKRLDLVVEAVVEDIEVKKKVFTDLEKASSPSTILATNTSSLSISAIAQGCKNAGRVVGMHFFNPVDKMPLVEVIRGKDTTDEAVATVFQFSKRLGKTPIVVKDSPGFIVNRILAPYLNEAVHLLLEGVTVSDLDHIMEKFGMPMGPCALLDEVGLDVVAKVSKVLYGAFGERMKPPPLMDLAASQNRLGKKTGRGIYIYTNGGKDRVEDSTLFSQIEVPSRPSALTDTMIEKRMVYLMINEGARCVEEGIVRDVADIDIGMIFGTGFAPFRGGILRYADSLGAEQVVSDLELFERNFGNRFTPCQFLQQLAVGAKKFYPDNL